MQTVSGTLYVCATPIGNLDDVTLRTLAVLSQVDRIVGEDSRRTRQLLSRHDIHTPFAASLYEGVEEKRIHRLIGLLEQGEDIALVSDAGTPLISDPGFPLVRACVHRGIPVVPVPGPSSLLAALTASGLPTDRFLFLGSLPRKKGPRAEALQSLDGLDCTAVMFDSPHRAEETLRLLAELYPQRPLCLARELTKVHEEFLRGTCQSVWETVRAREGLRGEIVLVIGSDERPIDKRPEAVVPLYQSYLQQGISPREALRQAAQATGLSRKEAYDIVHRTKGS